MKVPPANDRNGRTARNNQFANENLYHSLQARKLIVSCRPTVSVICWRNLHEQLGIKSFTHPSAPQFIASSSSHVADRFLYLVAREAFHRSGSAEKSRTTRRACPPSRP